MSETKILGHFNRHERHKPFIGVSIDIMSALAGSPMSVSELASHLKIEPGDKNRLSVRLSQLKKDRMINLGYFGIKRIIPDRKSKGRPQGRDPNDWRWFIDYFGWVELEARKVDVKILTPEEQYTLHRSMGRKFSFQDLKQANKLHDAYDGELTEEERLYALEFEDRQRTKQAIKEFDAKNRLTEEELQELQHTTTQSTSNLKEPEF